jgi:hypothetical protein
MISLLPFLASGFEFIPGRNPLPENLAIRDLAGSGVGPGNMEYG